VDLAGDGLINFQIGQPVTRQPTDAKGNKLPLASNTGTINADGGVVTMTARAAGSVVDSVVNVGGQIRARAVSQEGGVLVLDGGEGGTVNVTGTLDVSGKSAGQRGGQVVATAKGGTVKIASTAVIESSGVMGGGRVNIGGSYQGKGQIANARDVTVEKGAKISADATAKGNGGTVIVWSDNATVFGGTISARGGPQGGDGGFAEVSSKGYLDYRGIADLSAPLGTVGTLLLDPSEIEIRNVPPPGDTTESGGDPNTITGDGGTSILSVAVLEGALATANVIVDADAGPVNGVSTGTITVFDPFSIPSGRTLTLTAEGAISIQAAISTPGSANLTINSTASTIASNAAGTISLGNGTLTTTAAGTIDLVGPVTASLFVFNSTNGNVELLTGGNNISAIEGSAGAVVNIISSTPMEVRPGGITAGTFVFLTSTAGQFVVNGNVTSNSVSGGLVSITSTGAGGFGIRLNSVTISGPSIRLNAPAGDIIQFAGSIQTTAPTGQLRADAGGTVQLTSVANNVGFLVGSAGTDFRYVDADSVVLGGIISTDPLTFGGITIGAGRYLDIAADAIAILPAPGVLIGAVTGTGGADNPTGVTVLRPTTAGTAMVIGGADAMATPLTEAALVTGIRTGILRIGSIGRAGGLQLGGATTAQESAAGAITIQALNLNAAGSVIETLVLESGAAGTAISQTGPLVVGHLATAVLGSGAVELTNPDNSTAGIAHIARISDTELGTQSGTFRYVDGTFIPVVTTGSPTAQLIGRRDSGDTPGAPPNTAIFTTGGDVTLVSRTSGIQFINGLAAVGATVRLSAASDIFQDPTGGVVANALLARAGRVDLTTAVGLNDVRFLSGIATGGSETLGDFRLINNASVTVPAGGVAGDSLVAAVDGVHAGFGATLELAIRSGDITVNNTTLTATDGLVLLRRVAGATGSEIVLNNVSFDSESGSPNLVILDLTGSPVLVPSSFAGLKSSSTPPSGISAIPLGPNPDGGILLNNVSAGNTTVYLVGGTGSTIAGSGTYGLLGVYVAHSNPIALTGSVRQIDPTTSHSVTAPFSEPFDSTTFAGFFVRRRGAVVDVQTFNTCVIGTGICPEPEQEVHIPERLQRPPEDPGRLVGVPDLLIIDFATDRPVPTPLGLSTVILVNQGNEYFFNVDEERRKQRAARGGQ